MGRDLELFVAAKVVNDIKVANFNSPRSDDDTAVGTALEVASTFHGAIVLTSRLVQCNTNPSTNTRNLRNRPNKFDGPATFK